MSAFYNGLTEEQKAHVDMIVKETVEFATFGFLCVLDGVRAIEAPGEKGELFLYYERNGERTLINDPNIALHDLLERE